MMKLKRLIIDDVRIRCPKCGGHDIEIFCSTDIYGVVCPVCGNRLENEYTHAWKIGEIVEEAMEQHLSLLE